MPRLPVRRAALPGRAYDRARSNECLQEGNAVNKIICILVTASVLSGGSVYGQTKHQTHNRQNKPHAISDTQMDRVTAAGEKQSAVAVNNSTVTETNNATVNLSGSALNGATGMNIVNSSDALVGNGVNVYNGSLTT